MVLTGDHVRRLCTRLSVEQAVGWACELSASAAEFGIDTPNRMAHWLAQVCHESAGLTQFEEDLRYSAKRLAEVWPMRYAADPKAIDRRPNALATAIGGNPQAVANDVYANRLGNGAPETGDGWHYRGRGPIQLTGRANYRDAGTDLEQPLEANPDLVLQADVGARVAGWFWHTRRCNAFADDGDIGAVTKAINGGSNGLTDRIAWHKRALIVLGIA